MGKGGGSGSGAGNGKGEGRGEGKGEGHGDGSGDYKGKTDRIAVPAMPMPMAVVCCVLNFIIPGFGKASTKPGKAFLLPQPLNPIGFCTYLGILKS